MLVFITDFRMCELAAAGVAGCSVGSWPALGGPSRSRVLA